MAKTHTPRSPTQPRHPLLQDPKDEAVVKFAGAGLSGGNENVYVFLDKLARTIRLQYLDPENAALNISNIPVAIRTGRPAENMSAFGLAKTLLPGISAYKDIIVMAYARSKGDKDLKELIGIPGYLSSANELPKILADARTLFEAQPPHDQQVQEEMIKALDETQQLYTRIVAPVITSGPAVIK